MLGRQFHWICVVFLKLFYTLRFFMGLICSGGDGIIIKLILTSLHRYFTENIGCPCQLSIKALPNSVINYHI